MGNRIYVGGLEMDVTGEELKEVFEEFGEVVESNVITDRYTKLSRGFAFITFKREEDAKKAIEEANGGELDGKVIKVSEAKERKRNGKR